MEYAPPDYSFTGLQFNPAIFENEISTALIVPDPLQINELDTNTIKALTPASAVSLYQNSTSTVSLGWSSLLGLDLSAITATIQATFIYLKNLAGTCQIYIAASLNNPGIYFFPNTGVTSFHAGGIVAANAAAPTAANQGTVSVTAATLKTPLAVEANTAASNVTLYNATSGNVTLGNQTLTNFVKIKAISLEIDGNCTFNTMSLGNTIIGNASNAVDITGNSVDITGYTTINNTGTQNTDIGTGSNTGAVNIGNITSNSLNLTSAGGVTITRGINVTNGIKMAGTNISGVYWKVMYGIINGPAIGANTSIGGQFAGYGASFGGAPQVFVQVQNKTLAGVVSLMVVQVDAVPLTSNFYWSLRNNTVAAAAGSYNISWFAIGPA